MKNITYPKLHLKTVPLIAMLALGMALAPMSAMASNGDRGHHKAEQSKNVGKHHNRGHYRSEKHAYKEPRHNSHRRNFNHKSKHEYGTRYGRHRNKHVRHYPRYDRHYDHRGHGTTHYVINDYHHRDHYVDYDHLGFMIGLHTNNFDITFRD